MEKPISEQLAGLLPADRLQCFDRHADAITRCHLFGFMTDAQSDRARKKLLSIIQSEARKLAAAAKAKQTVAAKV